MATPSDSATTSKTEAPKSAPSLSPDQLAKFDLDKPKLPDFIADKALQSGNFPYDKNIKGKMYREQLAAPQYELVKLQTHVQNSGARIIALFEGRDSAGKGGCISRILEHLNPPRHARSIALAKPTPTE